MPTRFVETFNKKAYDEREDREWTLKHLIPDNDLLQLSMGNDIALLEKTLNKKPRRRRSKLDVSDEVCDNDDKSCIGSLKLNTEKSIAKFKLAQHGIKTNGFDKEFIKTNNLQAYDDDMYKNRILINPDKRNLIIIDGEIPEDPNDFEFVKELTVKVAPVGISCYDERDEDGNLIKYDCVVFYRDEGKQTFTAVNVDTVSDILKYIGGEKDATYLTSESIYGDLLIRYDDGKKIVNAVVSRNPIERRGRGSNRDTLKTITDIDILVPLTTLKFSKNYQKGLLSGITFEQEDTPVVRTNDKENKIMMNISDIYL